MADIRLRRHGIGSEQSLGGEDDAGRTKAALGTPQLDERALDRIKLAWLSQPFDGLNLAPAHLQRQHQAGIDRGAVYQDGAGSAIAVAASFLGPGQAHAIAQKLKQRVARIDQHRVLLSIDPTAEQRLHRGSQARLSARAEAANARRVKTSTSARR